MDVSSAGVKTRRKRLNLLPPDEVKEHGLMQALEVENAEEAVSPKGRCCALS